MVQFGKARFLVDLFFTSKVMASQPTVPPGTDVAALTTTTRIVCTTTPAPEGFYYVNVQVDEINVAACKATTCKWEYWQVSTPLLSRVFQNGTLPDGSLSFAGGLLISSTTEIASIKVGDWSLRVVPNGGNSLIPSSANVATAFGGDQPIPPGYYNVSVTLTGAGKADLSPELYFQGFLAPQIANLLVPPNITAISTNSVYSTGALLTITGAGLSVAGRKTVIEVEGRPCEVREASNSRVVCQLAPGPTTAGTLFRGGIGLERRVYRIADLNTVRKSPKSFERRSVSLVAGIDSAFYDNSVTTTFDGFFRAPINGSYRFSVAADDIAHIWFDTTPLGSSDPANLSDIAQVLSPSGERQFSKYPSQTSPWYSLQAGRLYPFRVEHLQWLGAFLLDLALELKPTDQAAYANAKTAPAIKSIKVNYPRNLETWVITIVNATSGSFNISVTERDPLTGATGWSGVSANISVNAGNGSVSNAMTWLGYNNVLVTATPVGGDLKPVGPTNVQAGFNYTLVFATSREGTGNLVLKTRGLNGAFTATATKTVERSPLLSGTFSLTVDGIVLTDFFVRATESWTLELKLRAIDGRNNFITVERVGEMRDGAEYRVSLVGVSRTINIVPDTSGLVGDPSLEAPSITVSTFREWSSNVLWYTPIPPEFFATNHTAPQLSLSVDGIPAVCSANCTIVNNDTGIPSISTFTVTGAILSLTIEKSQALQNVKYDITFGGRPCVLTLTTLPNIRCTIATRLNGVLDVIAGSLRPALHITGRGYANVTATNSYSVPVVISSASPTSGGSTGGYTLKIVGSGYGFSLTQRFNTTVTIGGVVCELLSLTTTALSCVVPAKTGASSIIVVAVNGVQVTSSAFSYDTSLDPRITDLNRTSASPVLKTPLLITGTNFGTNVSALSVFLDTASVRGRYKLSIFSLNSTSIIVILGGGVTGNYTLRIVTAGGGSTTTPFTYRILVNSISPSKGSNGGGSVLTITGENFAPLANKNQIYLGPDNVPCYIKTFSETKLTCETPPNVRSYTGAVAVNVVGAVIEDAICAGACQFTYDSSETPQLISVNDTTIIAGEIVQINGVGFSPEAVIFLNGTRISAAENASLWISQSSTALVFLVPGLAAGPYTVRVLVPAKGYAVATSPIVLISSLTLTALAPRSISQAGALLTLTGNGFSTESTVFVNGNTTCQIVSVAPTSLTCETNATESDSKVYLVNVYGPLSNSILTMGMLYNAPSASISYQSSSALTPTATPLSPNRYSAAATLNLFVSGTKLLNSTPKVTLVSLNDSSIVFEGIVKAASTNESLSISFSNVAAGLYRVRIHLNNVGFIKFTGDDTIKVDLSAVASATVSSYAGGNLLTISGAGFHIGALATKNNITVCGYQCRFSATTFNSVTCYTPAIKAPKTEVAQYTTVLSTVQSTQVELSEVPLRYFGDSDSKTNLASSIFSLTDSRVYVSTKADCWVGFDLGKDFVISLESIAFPLVGSLASWSTTVWEGSNDSITWTVIFRVESKASITPNILWVAPKGSKHIYRYVRMHNPTNVNPTKTQCQIHKTIINGKYYYAQEIKATASHMCNLTLTYGDAVSQISNIVEYRDDATPIVNSISPPKGSTAGGTMLTLSGRSFGTTISNVHVLIDEVPCVVQSVTDSQIVCLSGEKSSLSEGVFKVLVDGKGLASTVPVKYFYMDSWSSAKTWGGESPPGDGDFVFVPAGQILLVDSNTTGVLKGLVVEGTVIFDDRDINFDVEYIFIRGGSLFVGFEDAPITHNIVITLHGSKNGTQLPIYGNKVIGLRGGSIDIHGQRRSPTWTALAVSADAESTTITLAEVVDWKVGETIVLAATGFRAFESETRVITAVALSDAQTVLTLDEPLTYSHTAEVETHGSRSLRLSAEVGLLSRNIIIQGDEDSEATLYGAQIYANSEGDESSIVRISYTEVRNAGQAFQIARHPINLLVRGAVDSSFLYGNSLHRLYNRGIQLQGISGLNVSENVLFDTMGHAVRLEEGTETNVSLVHNLVVRVRPSFSFTATDQTPAGFSLASPSNVVTKNSVAGSAGHGYWLGFYNEALSFFGQCPQGSQLFEFTKNSAHANGGHGLFIYPSFVPRTKPCVAQRNSSALDELADNPPVTATLRGFSSWRNLGSGVAAEQLGDVRLTEFAVADNLRSGVEVGLTDQTLENTTLLSNSLIIGRTDAAEGLSLRSVGVFGPRTDYFRVIDVHFVNFDENMTALSTCVNCENSWSTDSGARTVTVAQLQFTEVVRRVRFNTPRREIIRDSDGTLTNLINGGWVTPFFPHNNVIECSTNLTVFDGLVCNNSVQVRRLAFVNAIPVWELRGMELKLFRFSAGTELAQAAISDFSVLQFLYSEDSWAFPVVTGYSYNVHWRYGLDFKNISLDPSPLWRPSDRKVNLRLNYTDVREKFLLQRSNKIAKAVSLPEGTVGSADAVWTHDKQGRQLSFTVDGTAAGILDILGFRCWAETCIPPLPPVEVVVLENEVRRWSNATQWPNGVVPRDGDNVVVLAGWKLLLDIDTASLASLEIRGTLFFDESRKFTRLTSKQIFVRSGSLVAGNETNPFPGAIEIVLTGRRNDQTLAFSESIDAGNKVLAVTGTLRLFAATPQRVRSRLLATAAVKSNVVKVEMNAISGWKVGDEVVVTSTDGDWAHSERSKISAISGDQLTLGTSLSFEHLGASSPAATTTLGAVDLRAEVALLSRSIVIRGSDEDSWGCRVLVTEFTDGAFVRRGRLSLVGVELINCGQADTERAAISFELLSAGTPSIVSYSAIHDSNGWHINLLSASNIELTNNVLVGAVKVSTRLSNALNTRLSDNLIVNVSRRTFSMGGATYVDTTAGLYVQYLQARANVTIIRTIVVGSSSFGFVMPGHSCDQSDWLVYNNTAVASRVGWLVTPSAGDSSCVHARYFTALRNNEGIVTRYSLNEVRASDLLLADNNNSLSLAIGSEGDRLKIAVSSSIIYGLALLATPEAYSAPGACSGRRGLRFGRLFTSGLSNPLEGSFSDDVNEVNADASFGGIVSMTDVSFVNFKKVGNCTNIAVFDGNAFAPDAAPVHLLVNTSKTNVDDALLFSFEVPPSSWIGVDKCGNSPCTGPMNVLVKDLTGDFLGSVGAAIPNNLGVVDSTNCAELRAWNGFRCNTSSYGLLVFESLDADRRKRIASPVTLIGKAIGLENSLNSFMDKTRGPNPGFNRLSRFPSLVRVNTTYNISWDRDCPNSAAVPIAGRFDERLCHR